jgi:hypothetical protein
MPAPIALVVSVVLALCVAATGPAAASAAGDPAVEGAFGAPFVEPSIAGRHVEAACVKDEQGKKRCKPDGGTLSVLPDGRVLYWSALEGTERVEGNTVTEFGYESLNDQSRVLDLLGPRPRWTTPSPADGGANPDGYETSPLVPGTGTKERHNDGALFCSDANLLADGRVLTAGGTAYHNDPGVDGTPAGVTELEGLPNTRIFDPRTGAWTQTGSMHIGRCNMVLVTLADGRTLAVSGTQKINKPIYPDRAEGSGGNVRELEAWDAATGEWTDQGDQAKRSLPLYPRVHLLPNGRLFYNVGGQPYNPNGGAYDEVVWNLAATYDPKERRWRDLEMPGLNTGTPGFRGSAFSIMLPLRPDAGGDYTSASFLSAGGTIGVTPGTYVATSDSAIATVDTSERHELLETEPTGDLTQPRWHSSGVLLPTGEVVAFSGADRDEVFAPGSGTPIRRAELFDPRSKTWRPLATATRARTYHNTATLLPDGRVLVGGHGTIPTAYTKTGTPVNGATPNEGSDPTFEIYEPPYMFAGPRPRIVHAPDATQHGRPLQITVDGDPRRIDKVVAMRSTTTTHVTDADQRSVELPIVARGARTLTVTAPPNGAVAPPGPYLLFVVTGGDRPVPSASTPLRVSAEPAGAVVSGARLVPRRTRVRHGRITPRRLTLTWRSAGSGFVQASVERRAGRRWRCHSSRRLRTWDGRNAVSVRRWLRGLRMRPARYRLALRGLNSLSYASLRVRTH